MILRTPDYISQFQCLAGACPRSCCTGWEVTIDDRTASFYRTVPGEFGQRLQTALTTVDGERCFRLRDGRCPLLDRQGLCEIYIRLGEAHISETCRLHPRFTEDYGPLQETSLSASCPAAAHLLLASQNPLTFPTIHNKEPGDAPDAWLSPLLICRKLAFKILQDRQIPWRSRGIRFLLLTDQAQALLDDNRLQDLPDLCAVFEALPSALPNDFSGPRLFPHALQIMAQMEILESDWKPLLLGADGDFSLPDWILERISCYFVFRYFLRTVNDGDLLSRAQLAVLAPLVIERLSGTGITAEEVLFRFCREMEHCQENLDALKNAFCTDPGLSLGAFFQELRTPVAVKSKDRL